MVEEGGLSPGASVRAATLDAACLLGRESEVGSIEPGKLADIIGIRASPLQDITALTDVAFVMKGGQLVKRSPA